MSAWIASEAHIAALASYVEGPYRVAPDGMTPQQVGQMLWQTNYDSVNYRYSESESAPTYRHTETDQPIVARLKLLDSYEYQACERPDWKDSEAYAYCQRLRDALISALPGYEEAPWGLHEIQPVS